MRKIVAAGLAALTLGGAIAATAVPAEAYPYGGWHGGGWGGGWGWGAAGLAAGLVAGAAIASTGPHYYYGPGYAYGPGYYGYRTCVGRRTVWDPYVGGYVVRSFSYAC